jgi:uncharacterized Zn finger protein
MPRKYPRIEDDDFGWATYVSVGERRRQAESAASRMKDASPVRIAGTRIANTFWGKAWCENLERYSDYANRLPRGRTYVRAGSVIDLKIEKGVVRALVSGSEVYEAEVDVAPISRQAWSAVCADCAGAIDSLVALAKGEFAKETMARLCRQESGMFPSPKAIRFRCSCPDSARMCKHIAAVLYGIGARLDENPDLLFTLRDVDQNALITRAGSHLAKPRSERLLEGENLSELFGIDIVTTRSRKPRRR